ncbi:MAG TPA: feruloyl-CoA synthase, partial [Stellaceae bacterium]|nr:feruloyl-CoA synthase [Stellaceae bacterium]
MPETGRLRRPPRFAEAAVAVEHRPDGTMILRSPQPLGAYPRAVGVWLEAWAARAPDRLFLAERDGSGGWRRIAYAAALGEVRAIAQALLDRGLGPGRPVMILSDNGIDHALLMLAAMHVGIPVVPVSTAYSRISRDFARLRAARDLVAPGLIFADDGERYAAALTAIGLGDAEFVVTSNPPRCLPATDFAQLRAMRPTASVDVAFAALGPDTVAKILLTSGSTGEPKGVINTQRMLCSNQEAYALLWSFIAERPPVLLDWLPWNHTFGGNSDFNMLLRNGGTLYIDDGRPVPGLIDKSVANLREVAPTLYLNVPRAFGLMLDPLERDADLARNFFRELDLILYAGAALPQSLWERLEALSLRTIGEKVAMVSAWGTTETAPAATVVHYPIARAGNIGLPIPGTEIKLVPAGDKLEIRVRGPNVTPGYWRRPDLTAAAFDEDGYYRPGDAARLEDPAEPRRGIVFDGRLGENFKLSSGTWVSVGALRVALVAACTPIIEDAVIAGHDRDEIGLLVFPSLAGCRGLCPQFATDAPLPALIAAPAVRDALAAALGRHNATAGGSSHRIARALFLEHPPSIDRGEITDKGYINQRAVLGNRAALVERLYADPPGADVVVVVGREST